MPLVVSLRRAGVAYDVQLNHRVPPKVSQKWIGLGTKVCSRPATVASDALVVLIRADNEHDKAIRFRNAQATDD